jgi:tetratricopeptide (TPR) repeat protein
MQAVLSCNRIRLALLQRNIQAAGRLENASERIDPVGTPVTGDLALERGRLAFMERNVGLTQALLKQAIVEYQEQDNEVGLARANLDFGIVLLAQENIHGAREYFRIATGIAEETDSVFEQIRALRYTLSCEFIHGNFSRVLGLADELWQGANAAGMREVQLFAEFARGRTQFELGRYAQAADTFATAKSIARVYGLAAPAKVAERWLGRSLVYDDRFTRGLEVLDACEASGESLFFAAEAWLRIGDHGESLRALARASELSELRCESTEAICWATGFSAFEDLSIGALGGSTVLDHQILALKGYVLAESGKLDEGIQEMYRLTREMRMSDADPFNRIYFYLYSLIIPESGESELEDASTVLGKAVRCIQERTSRMDQYSDKTDFLRQNFWNTRLMRQAQIHNLV